MTLPISCFEKPGRKPRNQESKDAMEELKEGLQCWMRISGRGNEALAFEFIVHSEAVVDVNVPVDAGWGKE